MPANTQPTSNAYVAAKLRSATAAKMQQIIIASEALCDHTSTLCPTRACIESWAIDWELYLWRTNGGRRLMTACGFPDDRLPVAALA